MAIIGLLLPASLSAHGALDEQIAHVTRELEQSPTNAALFLRRGDLHRLHLDWTNAAADFNRAEQLAPHLPQINLCRGRLWLDAGDPQQALGALDQFMRQAPGDMEGLITRARVKLKLDRAAEAAADFDAAFARGPAQPDHYLERADACAQAGHPDEALKGLDEGMKRLGPLVALQMRAVELELVRTNYDGAITRVDAMLARLPRKDAWLLRKGEILLQAGRAAEATTVLKEAQAGFETLPAAVRQLPANRDLATRMMAALDRSKQPTTKEKQP